VFMRAANIARSRRSLITTLLLCSVPPLIRGQVNQTFLVHGTPRSCSAITQMDSALAESSQQYFAGWSQQDYADALTWAQACADYGWHVPGRPRVTLLQAQHDKALAANTAPAAATPPAVAANPPPAAPVAVATPAAVAAPTAVAAPATVATPAVPDTAAGAPVAAPTALAAPAPMAAPVPVAAAPAPAPAVASAPLVAGAGAAATPIPVIAQMTTPAAAVPGGGDAPRPASQEPLLASTSPGIPLSTPAVQTSIAPQATPAAAAAIATAATATGRAQGGPNWEEDSLVTDDYFKKHFHEESIWVADRARLDIGDDHGPSTWPTGGSSAQLKNRITADKIVLYCARKTNAAESTTRQPVDPNNRPLLWDWRWCEAEEASAYNRLVSGNEFPSAGRGIVLGCASSDSYVYTERCIATVMDTARN
jgi:hypothetical protein